MEKQGYGRIVFCSSIASGEFFFFAICSFEMMTIRVATGGVLGPHYSSSKAAIHGLMHWVARQYSKKGIVSVTMVTIPASHVELVYPGRLATPLPQP
jgi:3-oxoacyl-[acyl-carrier protein] reductase